MRWNVARRARNVNSSVIREALKLAERPGIISFAGGLPAASTFPVQAFAEACARVLRDNGQAALQYGSTEGLGSLREHVAGMLPWPVDPAQVLITTGSQQGLDMVAKVLVDPGSRVLVETPTYLGALQAFAPMEPELEGVPGDDDGVDMQALQAAATNGEPARLLYLLPNFQNPTGRTMSEPRRAQLVQLAERLALPLVEDNPYGELWFEQQPPPALSARNADGCIYLGTFSKVLSPGVRLGYVVAPRPLIGPLLQAKLAVDLHTSTFTQHVVAEVLRDGFLERHVPAIRELYRLQRDTMLAALTREMDGLGVQWNRPQGGMFLWLRLPHGLDAAELLPLAAARGVAYVPGAPFHAHAPDPRSLRLSYVTATREQIDSGIARLADSVRDALQRRAA